MQAATIIPRWEWRTFEEPFGAAERRLTSLLPTLEEDSDEIYVLSRNSDASVKVRDGRIDVKRRLAVDDHGLEQWVPVMKAPFPLSPAEVANVLAALGADARVPAGAEYGLDAFLDAVLAPDPALLALRVRKHRIHYTVGGCMAELSAIEADGRTARTIAVESEDPAMVANAVAELGLAGRRVVAVAPGLKAFVGFGARRFAVIDVGTNSVKFHVAELRADGVWRTLVDRAEVTRLGEQVATDGRLAAAPAERTAAAVAAMAEEAREQGVEAVAVVGTAALRAAPNAGEFAAAVRAGAGLELEVISAQDEARLAFRGARAGLAGAGSLAVFDTGGGSSQFSFGSGGQIVERFSVNIGAVAVTERFGLRERVSEQTLAGALATLAADLEALARYAIPDTLIGMGGAVTNLAAVSHGLERYDPDRVHGTVLGAAEVERQIALYRERDADERRAITGLQPGRAEVILAGACIVRTVLTLLGRESLVVSDRGLRHGVLAERFEPAAAASDRSSVALR